jgi:hypothetical protein
MPSITRASPLKKPVNKADQNIKKIADLQGKTQRMNYEVKTAKLLATATKDHQQASVACYLANLSPSEKAQRDEDMRRMGHYYSRVCQEASPNWREDARAEFRNKRLS